MGKGGNGGNNRNYKGAKGRTKDEKKQRAEEWKNSSGGDRRKTWNEVQLENKNFDAFYQAMNFVEDGEEWDSFIQHLRNPLPATFRLNADYAFHGQLAAELQQYAGQEITLDDGAKVAPVEKMGWYPEGLAYKMGTDRRSIRKDPALESFHKWLTRNTDSGNITRQEAVSMVPPMALDVRSNDKCLDMCAAPGSKTSQLLELVNGSKNSADPGLVVANDSDTDRAYMLVHQCRRINSPLLIITTHKGQAMPKIRNPDAQLTTAKASEFYCKTGYFDRVLADVPCSGDGTLRKNPSIWGKWTVGSSITLHPLQIMIATRGVQLLKVGGLLTFSTCSMSPYEDEACVAELLRQADGTLELVDAREFLPKFKCRHGLSTWTVLDDKNATNRKQKQKAYKENKAEKKASDADADAAIDAAAAPAAAPAAPAAAAAVEEGEEKKLHADPKIQKCLDLGFDLYENYDDMPGHVKNRIRKSCFPPTKEEAEWMHLERCMRCVPHDEDTGGFFVATLRKVVGKTSRKTAAPVSTADAAEGVSDEQPSKRAAVGDEREVVSTSTAAPASAVVAVAAADPSAVKGFVDYAYWDEKDFDEAKAFYGLKDSLAREAFSVRVDQQGNKKSNKGQTQSRGVFYLPPPARELMGMCDLKVVSAGLKVFEKKKEAQSSGVQGDYRLVQEGIEMIVPHMTKRVLTVTAQDISNLLEGGLVSYSTMSDAAAKALVDMGKGPVVLVYNYAGDDVVAQEGEDASTIAAAEANGAVAPICIICNIGSTRAMNVLCAKVEAERCRHMLKSLRVFREKIRSEKPLEPAAAAADAAPEPAVESEAA